MEVFHWIMSNFRAELGLVLIQLELEAFQLDSARLVGIWSQLARQKDLAKRTIIF